MVFVSSCRIHTYVALPPWNTYYVLPAHTYFAALTWSEVVADIGYHRCLEAGAGAALLWSLATLERTSFAEVVMTASS